MRSSTIRLTAEPLEDRITPAAGDLDPTFGSGGSVQSAAGPVFRMVLVPDGHILTLQQTLNGSSPGDSVDGTVARFDADGEPDPTFGTGGVATVPGYTNTRFGAALAALPDGGAVVTWVPDNAPNIHLVHLTASGAIDPTFGTNGTAVVSVRSDAGEAYVAAILVQPDGRVLVAGSEGESLPQPPPALSAGQIVVARLTANGQSDPTFGAGGTTIVDLPTGSIGSSWGYAIGLQPDGRVLVSGLAHSGGEPGTVNGPVVIRLTSSGVLDPTFGSGGTVVIPSAGDGFNMVSALSDGRVIAAGSISGVDSQGQPTSEGVAVRLTAAGGLDPTYGSGGVTVTPIFGSGRAGFFLASVATAVDTAGRVVFDAETNVGSNPVYRLTPSGAIDAGFGTDGAVNRGTTALAIQPNGDILLGGPDGTTSSDGLIVRLLGTNPPAGFVPAMAGSVVAGGSTNGTVQLLNPANGTYSVAGTTTIYPGFPGAVRGTVADVNGDGAPDYVLAAGPGALPEVTVFDGKTGAVLADFPAFEPTFTGGVFVAAADLDGDGKAEIFATADQGGGGRVVVFSVAGGTAVPRASFFGIADPNFRGGARAAVGDVNHDGTPDLLVAAGFLGGPRVALFDGKTIFSSPTRLVNDFFAFPGTDAVNLRNGVFAALGDVNGDGFADLIFGGGPGGAPRVFILSGQMVSGVDVAGAQASPLANFFVGGNSVHRGGIRVAAVNADGDAFADLVLGSGEGDPATVRIDLGKNFTSSAEPAAFQEVSVFGGAVLPGGVYVG
jgi:uncharacterized delta-60 repeat protein